MEEEGKGKQAKLSSRKAKHCLECVKLLCVSSFDGCAQLLVGCVQMGGRS